jgi:hypothetical protein
LLLPFRGARLSGHALLLIKLTSTPVRRAFSVGAFRPIRLTDCVPLRSGGIGTTSLSARVPADARFRIDIVKKSQIRTQAYPFNERMIQNLVYLNHSCLDKAARD